MTERRWRILTALLSVAAALVLTHQVERYRAVRSPSGWQSTPADTSAASRPRIGDSRWVLSPGAHWTHEDAVTQWFMRARLEPGAQIIARHGTDGPQVRLTRGAPTTVVSANDHRCEGTLPAAQEAPFSLIFERTQDGFVFRSGEARVACSAPGVRDAQPELQVAGGQVDLVSIGVDEWPAGVPVSSLGWMGGFALVGFVWMLLLEWERARGVRWPVIILTGSPCLIAAVMLWALPAVQGLGVSLSLVLIIGSLCLKAITIAIGGPDVPGGEE